MTTQTHQIDFNTLSSLTDGYRAIVFGATGGVGAALVHALCADPRCARVYCVARRPMATGDEGVPDDKLQWLTFALDDEASIVEAVNEAAREGPLDLVMVATGLLHAAQMQPEKSWRALDPALLARAFAINSIGPALIAKHALPKLARDRKTVFAALSARVGSIEDNRLGGWYAYRASKAALNMLVRTLAIELARRHPRAVCVCLHPGTVDTRLSKPYQSAATRQNLQTPASAAAHLMAVIDRLGPEDSGRLFAWDGTTIPF